MKNKRFFLEHIIESIERIKDATGSLSKKEFIKSLDARDIVDRRLEIIGEAVSNLPEDFRNKYSKVPWGEIIGTRNKLIHEYFSADPELIWEIIEKDIPKLEKEIKNILDSMK